MMQREELKNQSRKNEKDFTRSRKIGFIPLICLIINMVRKSTQLELDEFRERFMPESANTTTYTKQSFSEARQKLSSTAFTLLNDELIREFYADDDFKIHYKGFRLLAIDASILELPNTKEVQKTFGYVRAQSKDFRVARAHSSHLYDVENKLVISSCIAPYGESERKMAKVNIEKMLSFEQTSIRNLILFDRAYPSAEFILYLQEKGIRYLMRSSACFYKEVINTSTPDETVRIEITKERAKDLKQRRTIIKVGTVVEVRVIKVELPTGEMETLVTNLTTEELSYEESKPLYFKRWGIETRFDELKHQFEIENFSGETPTVIEQDFHATTLLSNMASLIEQDAQEEMQEKNANKNLKFEEYKINHNILVGKLKNRLVEILLEEDNAKKVAMYDKLILELTRNIVPVIRGRTFPRKKKNQANKYAKTKRRSL